MFVVNVQLNVGKEEIVILVKGKEWVGKHVDLMIRKETRERAMSSVVRCFRDKIMFRKQDLVEKVRESRRKRWYWVSRYISNTVQLLMREILRQLEHRRVVWSGSVLRRWKLIKWVMCYLMFY